jgi:hypothetical protein
MSIGLLVIFTPADLIPAPWQFSGKKDYATRKL